MSDFKKFCADNFDFPIEDSKRVAEKVWRIQQAEIERLNTIIRIAAGYISTTDGWSDKHPEECLAWLLKQTGEVES